MYGVITRNEGELTWPEFDTAFYEVKSVSGRAETPQPNAVNAVSCFADNAAARDSPDIVPVNETGDRATREQQYFDWAHVCPSHERYRAGLLETIEECATVSDDVRLDDVGFPRAEYCHCHRCEQAFADSEYDDRFAWRASVIESFIRAARERVPGRLYLTLYPDPYPDHLYQRSGIDVTALDCVDEFVVPLYDTAYATTFWLEILAKGFVDTLSTPFSIELYAVNVDIDNLIAASEVAQTYAKDVLFGYDASTARAALRRLNAATQDGKSYEP
ncbi:hypothetical protein [Halocatena pleomorpha]|uniref:Glycoside hydrolase domain protein n=1 Tax=Halocatena pleomorpha TaxID=1785090 RepID=A0A3P3RAI2_9EURY|nr:hypothetical protein [Halocatena pleomorpha]RRJ30497.1 hypothetical protein EIK79_09430 [Halocatena pleomorpha]